MIRFLFCLMMYININSVQSQSYDPFIQSVVDQVSKDSLETHLLLLESYGRKQITDPALELTAEWLMNSFANYGYNDIQTDPFTLFGYPTYNIIVTKQGFLYPDEYIIIDGHYDTKTGPGVNDNGTGVAIILEIARLLMNIQTAYSIKFINFSAEEYGLIGSTHYVQNTVVPQNMNIRLVYNIDEVGGEAGLINDKVVCERDESFPDYNNAESWEFTDTLANLAILYSKLTPVISYAYGSDYVPFQTNGEIITGIFEYNYSSFAHTVHDSLINLDLDYVYEMAKLSVAAALYFAGGHDSGTSVQNHNLNGMIEIYPNPFIDYISISTLTGTNGNQFIMNDATGRIFVNFTLNPGQLTTIPLQQLNSGIYFYQLRDRQGFLLKSGKLFKIN